MTLQAVIHASEILTGVGIRAKKGRNLTESDLGRVVDGALVYRSKKFGKKLIPHKIVWVGPTQSLPAKYARVKKTNLHGRRAVIAGMIDCHTHLVFAGDRSEEFALRCGGATYEEIAAKGGGIVTTVSATRQASLKELEKLAVERVREMAAYGVRTIEVKSGYGLSTESEIKLLKVIPLLRKRFPELTFTATFLGAHAFPTGETRDAYLRKLLNEMLPYIAREGLADSCDVFVDQGYYTIQEADKILSKAKKLGLKIKVHADELVDTGSAKFAAQVGALSADHLLKISEEGIKALAASETVAVLLPGTAFYLKASYAPARKILNAGGMVALSTDFNPGTSMCLSLPTVMTIAALYLGMSRVEILAGVTYSAAKALGLDSSKGTLESGMDADFTILPFARFEEIYYRFAWAPKGSR